MTETEANHPLVIAQQNGLGPLSPAGKEVWHGNATPCVSCGQLIMRNAGKCARCGQDHGNDLLAKMARLSGPWFVHDHAHPFPGVSIDRILKLIERGQLCRTTIVRGPTTFYQWRFASEIPLVAQRLGYCWKCQGRVAGDARNCPACRVSLAGRGDDAAQPAESNGESLTPELEELSRLAAATPTPRRRLRTRDDSIGRGPLIFLGIAVIVLFVVLLVVLL